MQSRGASNIQFDKLTRISDKLRADYLEYYGILPVDVSNSVLTIGHWCDSPDPRALEDLSELFGSELRLVPIPKELGSHCARRLYGTLTTARDLVDQMSADADVAHSEGTIDDLVALANEAPVIQLVNLLLVEALEAGASDVHLENKSDGMQVRYRVDGVLQPAPAPPSGLQAPIASRLKIMADLDIAERRVPQDGRIRLRLQNREVDVRVSTCQASMARMWYSDCWTSRTTA